MRKSIMTIAMHHDVCETNGFKILISPTISFFSHIFIHTFTQSYMIKLLWSVVIITSSSSSPSRTGTILTTTSETYVAVECCYDSS